MFRIQAKGLHITIRDHHDLPSIVEHYLSKLTQPVLFYTAVCEVGHGSTDATRLGGDDGTAVDEDGAIVGYEHTHVAFWLERRCDIRSADFFDYGGRHPHIARVRDLRHFSEIYHHYHKKEAVSLYQSEDSPAEFSRGRDKAEGARGEEFKIAKKARSIGEAATALGLGIKSISDLAVVRNERLPPPPAKLRFDCASFTLDVPERYRCIYLYGPSGTGKTEWALHRFANPLLVRSTDELRGLSEDLHDGFVWDEFSPVGWTPEQIILAFDTERATSIRCRYSDAQIPEGFGRVFTSNLSFEDNILSRVQCDQREAVKRRVHVVRVIQPTFNKDA